MKPKEDKSLMECALMRGTRQDEYDAKAGEARECQNLVGLGAVTEPEMYGDTVFDTDDELTSFDISMNNQRIHFSSAEQMAERSVADRRVVADSYGARLSCEDTRRIIREYLLAVPELMPRHRLAIVRDIMSDEFPCSAPDEYCDRETLVSKLDDMIDTHLNR